ncbi:uncharacterized protein EI97DRAFT_180229 [Westerdykella ornata]|uniref:Uncharacterized protein n=1 Tax=Westerdykella ornata TaxID=318751 RepID=A0A6A6JUZ3_WESOR|nr:uncharacterized protein EI97DRAFT_180229 [Westerdykella ornata]KAF2279566.1 hypothetical protein EI97DRAFT_180229 [Westerdykella ornata]
MHLKIYSFCSHPPLQHFTRTSVLVPEHSRALQPPWFPACQDGYSILILFLYCRFPVSSFIASLILLFCRFLFHPTRLDYFQRRRTVQDTLKGLQDTGVRVSRYRSPLYLL